MKPKEEDWFGPISSLSALLTAQALGATPITWRLCYGLKNFHGSRLVKTTLQTQAFLWLDDALIPLQNFLNIWTLHPDFEDTFFSLHMIFLFFHATHMHNIGCNIKITRDPVN